MTKNIKFESKISKMGEKGLIIWIPKALRQMVDTDFSKRVNVNIEYIEPES